MEEHAEANRVWAMADVLCAMATRVAATLRISDRIADGIDTSEHLADACGVDPDALDRLLRYLVRKGLFQAEVDGRYSLTDLGIVLRDEHPAGLRAALDLTNFLGHSDLALNALLHAVRTGGPAYHAVFGQTFWEDLAGDRRRQDTFDAQMGIDIGEDAQAIAAGLDWGALGCIVDVGGGNGTLLAAILARFPGLRGIVVDLPATARRAERNLASLGLAERATVIAGSAIDPLPCGAGGYLLSDVLHMFNDSDAERILRNCADAVKPYGSVLIVEKVGQSPSPDSGVGGTAMDLRLLVYTGGKERNVNQYTTLAAAAGLHLVGVHAVTQRSIIEFSAIPS